jgi:hypothetical protein
VISGTLPQGIQCNANGLIIGVPQAVASLQGVPFPVNRNVISKFTLRAYTENRVNNVFVFDRIRDRTFELTVSGNYITEFTTPYGSFGTNNTATFPGAISGTELTVSAITAGTIQNGMVMHEAFPRVSHWGTPNRVPKYATWTESASTPKFVLIITSLP